MSLARFLRGRDMCRDIDECAMPRSCGFAKNVPNTFCSYLAGFFAQAAGADFVRRRRLNTQSATHADPSAVNALGSETNSHREKVTPGSKVVSKLSSRKLSNAAVNDANEAHSAREKQPRTHAEDLKTMG